MYNRECFLIMIHHILQSIYFILLWFYPPVRQNHKRKERFFGVHPWPSKAVNLYSKGKLWSLIITIKLRMGNRDNYSPSYIVKLHSYSNYLTLKTSHEILLTTLPFSKPIQTSCTSKTVFLQLFAWTFLQFCVKSFPCFPASLIVLTY